MSFVFRGLTLVLALNLALGVMLAERPSRRSDLPNFIVIVAHDLGPAEWGQLDGRVLATPHLDRLAEEGLRFTEAYAGSPAGAAARGSLLTGQAAGQARVRSEIQEPLAPEDVTLAEVVRSVGYRSGMIGLWGLGWEGTTGEPTRQGFNDFLGALDLVHGANEHTPFLWRNDVAFQLPLLRGTKKEDLAETWLVRGATNFIRISEDVPFLLWFAPNLPGIGSAPGVPSDPAPAADTKQSWTAVERARAARIIRLDTQVGTLLSEVSRRNLAEDTMIIFTSVPAQGSSQTESTNRLSGSGRWRSGGVGLLEGNLRVPLVAWWPGRIRAGTTNLVVGAWDILPTLAELSGAPVPPGIVGRSLASVLLNRPASTNRPALYWESHGRHSGQAGRIGQWKAILPDRDPKWELFDVLADPGETTNHADARPEIISQFKELFAAQARPWSPPDDGATLAAGRPGIPIPTNTFKMPMRTNYFPIGPSRKN